MTKRVVTILRLHMYDKLVILFSKTGFKPVFKAQIIITTPGMARTKID